MEEIRSFVLKLGAFEVDEHGIATHSLVMPGLTGMSSSWTFLGGADAYICVIARASSV